MPRGIKGKVDMRVFRLSGNLTNMDPLWENKNKIPDFHNGLKPIKLNFVDLNRSLAFKLKNQFHIAMAKFGGQTYESV